MAQENREAYIAWLREKLEDYCNDDGSYEVYWDYDDSVTPDQLVEAVDNWKSEGYTSPESYLASTLYDTVGEAQESQLYVSILDDLNDAPDEVRACWDESTGIWDDLYEAGYTGIDMNLDDLLSRSSFNVNLFFATETEKNFDMGSIVDSFGNDYREPRLEDIDAESLDNALSTSSGLMRTVTASPSIGMRFSPNRSPTPCSSRLTRMPTTTSVGPVPTSQAQNSPTGALPRTTPTRRCARVSSWTRPPASYMCPSPTPN